MYLLRGTIFRQEIFLQIVNFFETSLDVSPDYKQIDYVITDFWSFALYVIDTYYVVEDIISYVLNVIYLDFIVRIIYRLV